MSLADVAYLGSLGATKGRHRNRRAISRGDEKIPFDPNNPPPGTPEWIKQITALDQEKAKLIVGGAIGDLYKISVMASLADAASLKDVGITDSHGFGEGKGRITYIPLTPEQEKEVKRAYALMDQIVDVGLKIRSIKGLPENIKGDNGKEISDKIRKQAIAAYLGSGYEGPMSKYFRIRELASEFQSQRDNINIQISKGLSLLTKQGLDVAQKNLSFDPSKIASDTIQSATGIMDGILDMVPTVPIPSAPPPIELKNGKIWITGQEGIPIESINESEISQIAYSVFYHAISSDIDVPFPSKANTDNKALSDWGSTILAKSIEPILASRFVKKKALQVISKNTTGYERKIAKLLLNASRRAIISGKTPAAMQNLGRTFEKVNDLIVKGASDTRNIMKNLATASTSYQIEEVLIELRRMYESGLISEKDQRKIFEMAKKKKDEMERKGISIRPIPQNVAEIQKQAQDSIARSNLQIELRGLELKLGTEMVDFRNRADVYIKSGGVPPSDDRIKDIMRRMSEISSALKKYPEAADAARSANQSVARASDALREMNSRIQSTTSLPGGSGISIGRPEYNYYPTGPMGPPEPVNPTTPPPQISYPIAGLGSFSSTVVSVAPWIFLGVAAWLIMRKK